MVMQCNHILRYLFRWFWYHARRDVMLNDSESWTILVDTTHVDGVLNFIMFSIILKTMQSTVHRIIKYARVAISYFGVINLT